MEMAELIKAKAEALRSLANALSERVGDNEITDAEQARLFVEDWTRAVESLLGD